MLLEETAGTHVDNKENSTPNVSDYELRNRNIPRGDSSRKRKVTLLLEETVATPLYNKENSTPNVSDYVLRNRNIPRGDFSRKRKVRDYDNSCYARISLNPARHTTTTIVTIKKRKLTPGLLPSTCVTPTKNSEEKLAVVTTPNGETTHVICMKNQNILSNPLKRPETSKNSRLQPCALTFKKEAMVNPEESISYKEKQALVYKHTLETANIKRESIRKLFAYRSAQELAPHISEAEYAHLIAHSLGGKEGLDNIMLCSKYANSTMLIYEKLIKRWLLKLEFSSFELCTQVELESSLYPIAKTIWMKFKTDTGIQFEFPPIQGNCTTRPSIEELKALDGAFCKILTKKLTALDNVVLNNISTEELIVLLDDTFSAILTTASCIQQRAIRAVDNIYRLFHTAACHSSTKIQGDLLNKSNVLKI
jgi:hypothetical protein